jgi:hypothetical protein
VLSAKEQDGGSEHGEAEDPPKAAEIAISDPVPACKVYTLR